MRIDAALADELEPGEAFEQRGLNFRAFADEHQAFDVFQARRERVGVLHVVVPDRNLVALELLEARQHAERIEIIVEDRDLHAPAPVWTQRTSGPRRICARPSSSLSTMSSRRGALRNVGAHNQIGWSRHWREACLYWFQ